MADLARIPKVMNSYWDGSRLSYLQYLTAASFLRQNPDWRFRLFVPPDPYRGPRTWTTSEHAESYTGPDHFGALLALPIQVVTFQFAAHGLPSDVPEPFKSDLVRWHLLGTAGGGWTDMDVLYLRPLTALPVGDAPFDLTLAHDGRHHLIGFYLASPENPFFRDAADAARARLDLREYQSVGSRLLDALLPRPDALGARYPGLRAALLPLIALYPYLWDRTHALFLERCEPPVPTKTVGVHWFNGDRLAKAYQSGRLPPGCTLDALLLREGYLADRFPAPPVPVFRQKEGSP